MSLQRLISLQRHHGGPDHIPRGGLDLNVAVPDAAPDGLVQCHHLLHLALQLDAVLLEEEELLLLAGAEISEQVRQRAMAA